MRRKPRMSERAPFRIRSRTSGPPCSRYRSSDRSRRYLRRSAHLLRTFEPGRSLEPLEDLVRLGEERLRLGRAAFADEPLGVLELRNRQVERDRDLAEETGGSLEAESVDRAGVAVRERVASPPDRDTAGIEDLGEPTRKRVRRPRTLALMPSTCDRLSLPGVRFTLVRLYAPAYVTGR